VQSILDRGYSPDLKPFKSIGYAQMVQYNQGQLTLDRTAYEIKRETRHYAKRQLTWFRKMRNAQSLPANQNDTPESLRDKLLSLLPKVSACFLAIFLSLAQTGFAENKDQRYEKAKILFQKKEWAKDKNSAVKTSLEDFIIKAYALALEENRQFNSGILDGEMLVYGEINIGFAVDTPGGLMVPVITDTNKKTIPDIALTRASLVEKAVQGKLSDNDIQNVTSTVSNLGMIGIETFTPVLNPPLAIILGIGVVMQETVVVDGEIQPRHTGRLCLTFDHRAVDGYPAAQFLNVIKEKLENPEQLV